MTFANVDSPSPISADILSARIDAARSLLPHLGVEALVLFASPRRLGGGTQSSGNVHYFAGWTPMGGSSVMIIAARGPAIVLAPGQNEARVFAQRTKGVAETRKCAGLNGMAAEARTALSDLGLGARPTLGVAGANDMPAPFAEQILALGETKSVDRDIHAMRLVRHPAEIALHRKACEISDAMIATAMASAVLPGMTPQRLMADVEHAARAEGADLCGLWLATGEMPTVTCFELFELPAAIGPRDRIQLGTTLSYEGHFAQGLRIGVRGAPSSELQDCAALLIEMQDATLAKLVPGKPLYEVVDTLEALIDANCPYTRKDDPFRFQSCHGLGINYAEPAMSEALSPDRDRSKDDGSPLVAENMVLEIHPNFSLPGLGHVCAGDVAVVTATGAEWLTRYPRGLVQLD